MNNNLYYGSMCILGVILIGLLYLLLISFNMIYSYTDPICDSACTIADAKCKNKQTYDIECPAYACMNDSKIIIVDCLGEVISS